MIEIPAIKAEILAPFKMQGVVDITDNALLVRFKFTARPGNPASIQREAVKRLFQAPCPGLGIEFARKAPPWCCTRRRPRSTRGSQARPESPVAVAAS